MTTLHTSLSLVRQWLSSAPAILALALAVTACGAADDRPPPPSVETEESASDLQEEDADRDDEDDEPRTRRSCEDGDARECQIKLPKQGSVQNCVEGVRYCDNGVWGPCEID